MRIGIKTFLLDTLTLRKNHKLQAWKITVLSEKDPSPDLRICDLRSMRECGKKNEALLDCTLRVFL